MTIGDQDHGRVAVAVSVVLCSLDQFSNLGLGQVFAAAKLAVWPTQWRNCSFLGGWLHQPQVRFAGILVSYHSILLVYWSFYEQYASGTPATP
jgi:hypothetical protein